MRERERERSTAAANTVYLWGEREREREREALLLPTRSIFGRERERERERSTDAANTVYLWVRERDKRSQKWQGKEKTSLELLLKSVTITKKNSVTVSKMLSVGVKLR